jgi:hypothetical protein
MYLSNPQFNNTKRVSGMRNRGYLRDEDLSSQNPDSREAPEADEASNLQWLTGPDRDSKESRAS